MRQEREAFDAALLGQHHVGHHRDPQQETAGVAWEEVFAEGVRCEVVVTSVGAHPNGAAIGIRRSGPVLSMKVYAPSNTFANLRLGALFGINVVTADQLDLVARCALKGHGDSTPELLDEELEWLQGVPVLYDVSCRFVARVTERVEVRGGDELGPFLRARIHAAVIEGQGDPVRPLVRPGPPLLEGLIAATRLPLAQGRVREQLLSTVREAVQSSQGLLSAPHPLPYKAGHPDGVLATLLLQEALARAGEAPRRG